MTAGDVVHDEHLALAGDFAEEGHRLRGQGNGGDVAGAAEFHLAGRPLEEPRRGDAGEEVRGEELAPEARRLLDPVAGLHRAAQALPGRGRVHGEAAQGREDPVPEG
eukprot:CAMPEP_0179322266 /NCGR_PEP_ID=MMETSP0797-20121207/59077_1 /TAXON_ID=47934 /ORGANISM="Dinophysis acuminata, Strain DAEP01" /LENGTH=106 /DNA_ID=CAMNT_0021033993 /DNA_START=185 /DNA_END=502 /DNA_ORIENTATION=-